MTVVERSLATCLTVRGAFLRLWLLGLAGAAAAATEPLPANLLVGARLSEFGIRVVTFANTALVLAALIGLGAVAVREVGLHSALAPRAHRHHLPVGHAFHWVQAGVLVGACVVVGQWLFDWWFWQAVPSTQVAQLRQAAEMSAVSPLTGLLLHAVNEELMLRWGLMSGLLWVLALLFRQTPGRPKAALAWAAILGVSVLSAAGQIPSLAYAISNDPAGILLMQTAAVGAVAGVAYGWLFWKHGLEAAILAHLTAQAGLIGVSGVGGA